MSLNMGCLSGIDPRSEQNHDHYDGCPFHDQEEQRQEEHAHQDDGDDEEEELNMPAQLQEEVAAQLRNPAVSTSGRIRKAPMRYGIDPVEQERAACDDNKELQLNDSTLTQRTLTFGVGSG